MTRLIAVPNLPKSAVKGCIISQQISKEIKKNLSNLNIELFYTDIANNLSFPVASHPDMLAHHFGGKHIYLEQSQEKLFKSLKHRGLEPKFIEERLNAKYPNNIALNCLSLKDKVFCNMKYSSIELLNYYTKAEKQIIHVNQGYTKCSALPLTENAVISDDEGIVAACLKNGIDALLIEKGDIVLEGYSYGFIGGCGGLIDKDTLALFGDLNTHRDAEKIRNFASKYRVKIIALAKGTLVDYGGLLPILEQKI